MFITEVLYEYTVQIKFLQLGKMNYKRQEMEKRQNQKVRKEENWENLEEMKI